MDILDRKLTYLLLPHTVEIYDLYLTLIVAMHCFKVYPDNP